MPLVRAWTRGLSGASGAALLVPGGIIAALLLLALAGSFGRVGGLGQAFSGPAAPGATSVASTVHGPAGRAPTLLPVLTAPPAVAPAVVGNRAAPIGSAINGPPPAAPPGRSPSGGGGAGAPSSPASPGAPSGSGGCGSCTPPPTHQTLVDQVVNLGTSVTSKLPGQVGQ